MTDWKIYQEKTAELFRSLACESDSEVIVRGARGEHKVDIWVRFSRFGLQIKWVVECKFWKTAVTKEKVLALRSIVEDVGADRGVLMSETGFQSGAIRVAEFTNITLTSFDELARSARDEFVLLTVQGLEAEAIALSDSLHKLFSVQRTGPHSFTSRPFPGGEHDSVFRAISALSVLEFGFKRARIGIGPFPIRFDNSGNQVIVVATLPEFVEGAAGVIADVHAVLARQPRMKSISSSD